jgi:homoserine kinase type II
MKLTKKDVLNISKIFNLGAVENYNLIKGGLVNYNYLLNTKKGKYIVRIIGDKSPKALKELDLQFKIFEYLKNKKFPYLIPSPLERDNSRKILNIGSKKVWVYEMISGKNFDRPSMLQIKLMAKTLATYHKYISGLKGVKQKDESEKRILQNFKKMKKITLRDEADKLALKYKDYFMEIFDKVKKIKDSSKQLFVHGDFDSSNVLFKGDKLIGIIDFGDSFYAPRIFDVSVSIRDSCYTRGKIDMKKVKIFLREYEKVNKLSKKEKSMIIPTILKANVDFFVWAYVEMKKEKENRKKYMKEMIDLTKDIIDNGVTIK